MDKKKIQLILGVILVMAGMGVFYRIPQVMPKVATIKAFSSSLGIIKFSFYMLGVFLIFAGVKKIHDNKNGNKTDRI